jgi:signal transduction histidine kinase/CheY-like chemotaxis protein/HAMP domain-containing protein
MPLTNMPLRRKLVAVMLLTSTAVLALTCAAFVAYDFVTERGRAAQKLTTIAEIIATNSAAALAFDNQADATQVLAALDAEPTIEAAALFDGDGQLFATYPDGVTAQDLPHTPGQAGLHFEHGALIGIEPVVQSQRQWGTLYLRSDMGPLYDRLRVYMTVATLVLVISSLLAYLLSNLLQRQISRPIHALVETARAVSDRRDYSVRAPQIAGDEMSALTTAFNHMLTRIQEHDEERKHAQDRLQSQLHRLDLLQRITRAIGERQDLRSIFQVVIRRLEDNLPIDFGCICLYDAAEEILTVTSVGVRSGELALKLAMTEEAHIPIDQNGLSRCVQGHLVYEPDIAGSPFPFPRRLADGGLRSLVIAPLLAESNVFGVLVAARSRPEGFDSSACEFLRQLSEHVALAAHQAQLYTALQQAYDDLRQSQQTVMQQERLRALGQMASGVAHDINNAISPIALYTDTLLEREPGLSEIGRKHLTTIRRAIDDVAQTVVRMREFYRPGDTQADLARVDLNLIVQQTLELTRVRWRDVPQERGLVIEMKAELPPQLPEVMAAESEIRDALTNLIFNAVDAMPQGGTLSLRTRVDRNEQGAAQVLLEVSDTGIGMDEETRRRCLEPFFTTKGERGTGLGLAMVYGMIQRHRAELEIDTAVGSGTTMRLVFPVAPSATQPAPRVATLDRPTRRLRILLVDDDPLVIESMRITLQGDGHEIAAADGGQAGIDTFTAALGGHRPFDLVITDLGMPYIDGRRVAAAVKHASAATPVILLTGWGQRLIAENDVPIHVDRVLRKPPKLAELRRALAELSTPAAQA